MKILLFGKDGQIGSKLHACLAPLGTVVALGKKPPDLCGDLSDLDGIAQTVAAVKPDLIVNAAAYTCVDKAEGDRAMTAKVNGVAPGVLADAARACGAWLVHYSTDYVFDGSGDRPWREDDATGPINFYGETKRAGEQAIQTSGCRHLIFRTSWIYGWNGRNFPKTILRLARDHNQLRVIDDQVGGPTPAALVANVTAQVVQQALRRPESGGIYHLAATGETSWYGYACFILAQARDMGLPLKAGPAQIRAVTSQDYPTPATRPLNSRLDTGKLRRTFEIDLIDWQAGILDFLKTTPPEFRLEAVISVTS